MKVAALILIGCLAGSTQAATVLLEDFEASSGVSTGSLGGQNSWSVNKGSGEVQTSVVESGSQALEIAGGSVSKQISPDGSSLWMHFQARIEAVPRLVPKKSSLGIIAAFYVNTNQNLVAYSNGVPVELAAQMPLNTWTRFDIYCDSAAGVWNLAMDGINVASGLQLGSSEEIGQVRIANDSAQGAFVDSLDAANSEQIGEMPDSDNDGVPDWWEQKYFGGATGCVATAPSGNGNLTYKETYIAAVSPLAYDPLLMTWDNGELVWTPKIGRKYDVEWAPDLQSDFVVISSDIPWPEDRYSGTAPSPDAPTGFYRIKIHL